MTRFLTLSLSALCAVSTAFSQIDHINSGNPARPFGANKQYKYGMLPTNLPTTGAYGSAQDAAKAYNYWVEDFVEDCGDGSKRVKFDQIAYTVSEGIAYGMLLSAYAGDKETFDGLWAYYKKWSNANGVMHWKIQGCEKINSSNGATDAELDAAMALIVAAKQWENGSYAAEAKTLITAIREKEMVVNGDTKPGDSWNSARNPSYYAPAYYRQYAKIDTENAEFWEVQAVEKAEWHLLANRHAVSGLVSDWSDIYTAQPKVRNNPSFDKLYGYEAVRNPWRMATDFIWHGPDVAIAGKDICGKVGALLVGKETAVRVRMNLDGTPVSNASTNGASYMTALAAMGTENRLSLNSLYKRMNGQGGRYSFNEDNSNYFNATLRCISLFVITGNFWNPSDELRTTAPESISVTGVSLNKNTLTLEKGQTATLVGNTIPMNATNPNITWTTSDASIVAVSSTGIVTAKAQGSATVTISSQEDATKMQECEVTVVLPTAIDVAQMNATFVLYPSPVNNVVNIETAQAMKKITVFNTLGVQVYEKAVCTQLETIEVSNFVQGVYFVRIELQNGTVENTRFVKQ